MHFSHFGPEANLFEEFETLFRVYGESGTGKAGKYLHEEEEAAPYQQKSGTLRRGSPSDTDMLFYEGLHGAIVTETVNVAQYADLLIGVVPVITSNGSRSSIATRWDAATHKRRLSTRSCAACPTT